MFVLSSKDRSEDFTVEYVKPLKCKRVALQSFSMWASWNNISHKYDNNRFSYNDGQWKDLTIPDGNYTLRELNDHLVKHFGEEDPPIKFGVVLARQRFVLKLAENYKVDFSTSKLHEILGFEPRIYEEAEQEAKYIANISRGVDDLHIHCDIVEGASLNDHRSEVLYSFTPSNPPGSLVSREFERPVFYPVKRDHVSRIRMRVTNQDGELIDLNGQKVLYRLLVE